MFGIFKKKVECLHKNTIIINTIGYENDSLTNGWKRDIIRCEDCGKEGKGNISYLTNGRYI